MRHQDGDHVLAGVRIPGRAQTAVPAVFADGRRRLGAPGDHRDAEAPAVAVEVAGDESRANLLLGHELVGRHRLDRGPRENAHAAVSALVQHHLAEDEVVVKRRDEPPGAGKPARCGAGCAGIAGRGAQA